MPSSSLIAQANLLNVPLLLVSGDTYDIARQIENMESLLTKNDVEKIALIEQLVRRHVHIEKVLAR
jgi:BioD-like phosphotransacetylase family protein